jgi:isopentenyl-diphosphate delta-isomerase
MNTGLLFKDWGIATPIAIVEARTAQLPLIATGGVRNGLDVARALSLGASVAGIGLPFLKAASQSYECVCEVIESTIKQLKVAMQLSGATNLRQLSEVDVVVTGATREWLTLRGFDDELKALAQRRWRRMQIA